MGRASGRLCLNIIIIIIIIMMMLTSGSLLDKTVHSCLPTGLHYKTSSSRKSICYNTTGSHVTSREIFHKKFHWAREKNGKGEVVSDSLENYAEYAAQVYRHQRPLHGVASHGTSLCIMNALSRGN